MGNTTFPEEYAGGLNPRMIKKEPVKHKVFSVFALLYELKSITSSLASRVLSVQAFQHLIHFHTPVLENISAVPIV